MEDGGGGGGGGGGEGREGEVGGGEERGRRGERREGEEGREERGGRRGEGGEVKEGDRGGRTGGMRGVGGVGERKERRGRVRRRSGKEKWEGGERRKGFSITFHTQCFLNCKRQSLSEAQGMQLVYSTHRLSGCACTYLLVWLQVTEGIYGYRCLPETYLFVRGL